MSPELANSPTFTSPATQFGEILGTAAHMSPEQAKGRIVDRRTDVWAFGAVVYEMLTDRSAFAGDSVSDTLARILMKEPNDSQVWILRPVVAPPADAYMIQQESSGRVLDAHDTPDMDFAIVARPNRLDSTRAWIIKPAL